MSEIYELKAQTRTESGKGASRRTRRLEDKVPGIIYGGEKNPTSVLLEQNELSRALENEGFYSHLLTVQVDGKPEKVVLKDIQRHPSKPKIIHIDFLRVSAKTKLNMPIPIHFKGEEEAPGVKDQGGVITHHMTEVEVRCLPADLPEFIAVDVSKLNLDESIHLSDLKLPKGVEILALAHGRDADQPVFTIHKPHIIEEEEVTAAPEEEEAVEVTEEETASKPAEGETKE